MKKITKLATFGMMVGALSVSALWADDNKGAAATFSGQAIAVQIDHPPGPSVILGDTGLLPATGGKLESKVSATNLTDVFQLKSAQSKTSGSGDDAESKVELKNFSLTFVTAGNETNTVSFKSLEIEVEAECKLTGVKFKRDFDIDGLKFNGVKVAVTNHTNQVFTFPGGSLALNVEASSSTSNSAVITATALLLTVDSGLTAALGFVHADVTCLPPPEYGGQAIVMNLTGPLSILTGDTGPLPSTGGELEAEVAKTNLAGVFAFSSAEAETSGAGDDAESSVEIKNFSITFTNLTGGTHTLSFKSMKMKVEADCDASVASLESGLDIEGLKFDGVKVHVTHEANQVVTFDGGSFVINSQMVNTTTHAADITASGIFLMVDGGLTGPIGFAYAVITCPTP